MAFKFSVHGIEVTANSAKEAAALIRELQPAPSKQKVVKPPQPAQSSRALAPVAHTNGARPSFNLNYTAVSFLRAIQQGGPQGIGVDKLMATMGVQHPKGVGSRIGMINGVLKEHQLDAAQIYETARTANGRIWKAGPKIGDALKVLTDKGMEDLLA